MERDGNYLEKEDKIDQNQFFDLISGEELSWQSIIYDLINSEQLDPWDIDIGVLADRYVETIQGLEEADFFVSSKILLACSLLLRLKSEILINSFIKDLDDALFGKKDDKKYEIERIELEEGELPTLVPRTPMSRHRKVTLQELMISLNKAIDTENRRIKKEIRSRQAEKDVLIVMPKGTHIPLKVRVKSIFGVLSKHLNDGNSHMKFSQLAESKEEKLASFVPILHLSNESRVHLRQIVHFEEIHMKLTPHEEELKELESELGLYDGTEEQEASIEENIIDGEVDKNIQE